ncbi:MAG: cobalt ECF transporter T component CbiQ [Chloroflexi bacterium]|nr:cobalt ECF transporter T component CbiQ [Chloroflexota bacterium]MDA1240552.1 cobalt ECF transporter T component CbiQ [Chloroflexota bacterium]
MSIAAHLDRYAHRNSPVHRLDARAKVPAVFAYVLVISTTREADWTAIGLLALPVLALVIASRLGPWLVLRRTFLALPFVMAAVPLMFTRPGETVFTLPLLGWTASDEGIQAVATILARSWLSVAMAVVLVSSTPMVQILRALRWLRVPRLLVATISFTYRYFFVIGEEAQRMIRARDSRSARLPGLHGGGSVRWRARVVGHMAGSLFVRSLERSERVHAAMQARGYRGEPRFLDDPPLPALHLAAAAAFVVLGVAMQAGARL